MTSHFRNIPVRNSPDPFPASFNDGTRSRIEDFEYSQRAKPLKALIGLGVLTAIVLALWQFSPNSPRTVNVPPPTVNMDNRAAQTTGQTPARPAPPPATTR